VAAQCSRTSTEATNALVELYTSEGCNSCPPADAWLSRLRSSGHGAAIGLAFHVDYWDYIGWKDPFARAEHTTRQRWLAQVNRSRAVYTPQVVVNGRDFRRWYDTNEVKSRIQATRQMPARARLDLHLDATGSEVLARLSGQVQLTRDRNEVGIFLVVYESNLRSRVTAGENNGTDLRHDYVVRALHGPFVPEASGVIEWSKALRLDSNWKRADIGVVAFVQSRASGDVYQAIDLPLCQG
jgi:hypothetical protein